MGILLWYSTNTCKCQSFKRKVSDINEAWFLPGPPFRFAPQGRILFISFICRLRFSQKHMTRGHRLFKKWPPPLKDHVSCHKKSPISKIKDSRIIAFAHSEDMFKEWTSLRSFAQSHSQLKVQTHLQARSHLINARLPEQCKMLVQTCLEKNQRNSGILPNFYFLFIYFNAVYWFLFFSLLQFLQSRPVTGVLHKSSHLVSRINSSQKIVKKILK